MDNERDRIAIEVQWSEEDACWVAKAIHGGLFKYCSADGETRLGALRSLLEALESVEELEEIKGRDGLMRRRDWSWSDATRAILGREEGTDFCGKGVYFGDILIRWDEVSWMKDKIAQLLAEGKAFKTIRGEYWPDRPLAYVAEGISFKGSLFEWHELEKMETLMGDYQLVDRIFGKEGEP